MTKSRSYSWGKFPRVQSNFLSKSEIAELKQVVNHHETLIPYGNGRSYGDSALASTIVSIKDRNKFLAFDDAQGELHVQSGVLLKEILDVFVKRGWFLKITPGTKLITVGGAIASDIHGKNHHQEGCFSECVVSFDLLLPSGEVVLCSRESNVELFLATCGGMGLTGIILNARIKLKRVQSAYIRQKTIKTKNLEDTFAAFEKFESAPYSVAWIDCLAKNKKMGRSLLMVGDFEQDENYELPKKRNINIPFNFPSFALNKLSVKLFNWFYYNKVRQWESEKTVDYNAFFYPLDSINNWNRIYGKKGFTQYQFILPKEKSFEGLSKILELISDSGKGSFLAVLKLYGKKNDNYLSFPIEGYSLALDFKIEPGLFELLDRIDQVVIDYGGRIYLTKDVRVSREVFEKGYSDIEKFRALRKKYKMDVKFNSLQSKRVEI